MKLPNKRLKAEDRTVGRLRRPPSCVRSLAATTLCGRAVRLSNDFSGALRTFAYFMASGTHYMLEGVDYLALYGEEPSAIEQAFAIFANVIELDENGDVRNFTHAQKRATDYIRSYCDPAFIVSPPFEDWEIALHGPPK